MNLYLQELKAHRKSLTLWCVGMILMLVMGMAKMTAYQASGDQINQLFSQMPKVFKVLFGATGAFDLSTAKGFFALLFLYIVMMAAIHAVLLGAEIITKEEQDKTVEFLLAKPLSRSSILTSKLLAGLTNVLIFGAVTTASSILIVGKYNTGSSITGDILLLMSGMICAQLIFYCIGIFVAAASHRAKSAAQIAASSVLVAYLLYVLVGLFDTLSWLRFATAFQYFEASRILTDNSLNPTYLLASGVIIVVCIFGAYAGYTKREPTLN